MCYIFKLCKKENPYKKHDRICRKIVLNQTLEEAIETYFDLFSEKDGYEFEVYKIEGNMKEELTEKYYKYMTFLHIIFEHDTPRRVNVHVVDGIVINYSIG